MKQSPRQISVRFSLMLAMALTVVPATIACIWIAHYTLGGYRDRLHTEVQTVSRVAAAAVDASLSLWMKSLERLALDIRGEPIELSAPPSAFLSYMGRNPEVVALALVDGHGRLLARTGGLSDRELATVVAAMNMPADLVRPRRRISNLQHLSGGEPVIAAAVPVVSEAWGRGALLAIHRPDGLLILGPSGTARPGADAAVLDENNVIVDQSNPARGTDLLSALEVAPGAGVNAPAYDLVDAAGHRFFAASYPSVLAPWRVAYAALDDEVDGTRQFSLDAIALIALLILSIVANMLLGNALGRRLTRLAVAAAQVDDESAAIALPPTHLRELTMVQTALQDAHKGVLQRAASAERLREMELALQRALRLETVGQVTTSLAHDFGNMIFAIRGHLTLLQRELPDNEQIGRLLAAPLRLLEEAAQLIAQLLSGAGDRDAKREWVDVCQVVRELTDLLRQVTGRGIVLSVKLANERSFCHLNPTLLNSALLNLVVNARQAMRRGGTITIRTASVMLDAETAAALQLNAPGCYLTIAVADNGPGIPEELRERIFEPFFTTRDRGAGHGIGLSIIRGFVTSSEGQVVVDSVVGKGTTFTMYFPQHAGATPPV